ncbi:hypothetical protein GCM10023115_56850 [Pontixanthobacter gangjinensis]|uniref:Uncharacterized protein n=1 Tax=Christiangramia aestuarii TaxID=1028746 RepID=A0A7K1LST3_9FLAO|nr:hypothetical protein [Christiangramia aestuarii]MUP43838.1 hypothetical protein [Christiangramia aestuarii]
MRRLLFGIFSLSLLASCDDGDIIVTDFDFDESRIEFCDGPNKNVFYAINNDGVFESISLEYRNNELPIDDEGNLVPPDPIDEENIINLDDQNNRIVYRLYNGEIPTGSNSYFCSVVPPSQPRVVEEWVSGSGAFARITAGYTDETGDVDADGDGIDNIDEGWDPDGLNHQDTDSDGIPDYLDEDDDGDNVLTSVETSSSIPLNDAGVRDTDEDGILNYLDSDDDNDGVPTRLEVDPEDPLEPTLQVSTELGPDYLNPEQMPRFEHDQYKENVITRTFGFRILIEELQLTNQDGSGETQRFGQTYNFGNYNQGTVEVRTCPSQDPDCGEPESEEPTNAN